ncbi:hypothetical protein B0T26DRAFT_687637, partial [Lasiosphaeria miniovina]
MSFQGYPPVFASFPEHSYPSSSLGIPTYHTDSMMQMQSHHKRPSLLMTLPPDILRHIAGYLGYLDLHNFCAVNRWTKQNVDPFWATEEERIAGVRHAEQYYKRYFPTSALPSSDKKQAREYDNKYPLSFGCYHCFMIKSPENFELFKWNNTYEEADSSSVPVQPTPRPTRATLPTTNPHYDPSITRTSIAANSQASSTGGQSDQSPRIKATWGVRRFCIDCGIKKQYYRPGDLIDLQRNKEAVWVCRCWKILTRPKELKCYVCDSYVPLSTPPRRRN